MSEALAIQLLNVTKTYKLHGSQRDQLVDVLGLQRLGFRVRTPTKEFTALADVSLEVPRGHRIGIIGRNGAGKTTLLKLICGNYSPTRGEVTVNGSVQALMHIGLGFHPEYTGRQNVESSLQYNGLKRTEYGEAMQGIIDFCELDEFFDQPFKTYSLGMQARLMFAAATAIRPDILIVDEVLGAGDAYFVAKSKLRVQGLVNSGCTMLLVSHSMQQVLELCDEVLWLDRGAVRMRGEAFTVVKAYEEWLHGPISRASLGLLTATGQSSPAATGSSPDVSLASPETHAATRDSLSVPAVGSTGAELSASPASVRKDDGPWTAGARAMSGSRNIIFQEPRFQPHAQDADLLSAQEVSPTDFHFVARGGVSRWDSPTKGVKVCGFAILTNRGLTNALVSLEPVRVLLHLVGEESAELNCRYGIAIHDLMGRNVSILYSPPDAFRIKSGELRKVGFLFNPLQLGPGDYTLGISVLEAGPLEMVNSARRHDLLARSFEFSVRLPESLLPLSAAMFHSVEWELEG